MISEKARTSMMAVAPLEDRSVAPLQLATPSLATPRRRRLLCFCWSWREEARVRAPRGRLRIRSAPDDLSHVLLSEE
ncbi:hypothetical protein GJAV_G00015400 [Gymnothorax javanicus]|nr:hypothetical protein GJAV_G00015400 [Gymnothorax javanicus]